MPSCLFMLLWQNGAHPPDKKVTNVFCRPLDFLTSSVCVHINYAKYSLPTMAEEATFQSLQGICMIIINYPIYIEFLS